MEVELFENERYAPFRGFCSQGLLPTDRKAVSTNDGSVSFSSLAETSAAILGKGWKWSDDDWYLPGSDDGTLLARTASDAAEESANSGWQYAIDFSGPAGFSATSGTSHSGSVEKKHIHFVRRRKLVRKMVYEGIIVILRMLTMVQTKYAFNIANHHPMLPLIESLLLPEHLPHTNQHYDDRLVNELSHLLLIAFCNTKSLSNNHHCQLKLLIAKNQFVQSVLNTATSLSRLLDEYKQSGTVVTAKSSVTAAQSEALAEEAFPLEERLGLARAVVRRLDSLFEYHCSVPLCGVDCVFAVQRCPHEGCTTRFSRKWWAEHDQSCVHKVVPCALQCGRCLPVHACADHVKNDCIMRPVACPFERMGCKPPVLLFKDVDTHCRLNHAYHLSLATPYLQTKEARLAELQASVPRVTAEIASLRVQMARLR